MQRDEESCVLGSRICAVNVDIAEPGQRYQKRDERVPKRPSSSFLSG
jgi:hypothetical protein